MTKEYMAKLMADNKKVFEENEELRKSNARFE